MSDYFSKLDEIDKWLFDSFGILPGACSSTENLRHTTARIVAEVLWPKKDLALLPKYKWKILDEQKAKDAKIGLLTIDEETTLLQININDIPKGIAVLEWIELLKKTGIIFLQR